MISQSLLHARINREKKKIRSLADVEFRGFSQWGEDGILDWLIEKIPGISESFIEFGVENYRESNTRMLLWLRNWRGLIMDGSQSHIEDIRGQEVSWRFDLHSKCAFIDRDNINQLISQSGFAGELGVLSVDIDGNDYWVWEAIEVVSPAIVVCEYNAVFGDLRAITVPYSADFQISQAHCSTLYFGASIHALSGLAMKKGYTLVGTNSNACNVFYVRNDYAASVLAAMESVKVYPSRMRTSRNEQGGLTFSSGLDRAKLIAHLPVFDVDLQKTMTLAECGMLYSQDWAARC